MERVDNSLYAWLRRRGYWVYSANHSAIKAGRGGGAAKSAPELTHVFLDGGRASVPRSELPSLWEAYIGGNALTNPSLPSQQVQHVVERTGAGEFKMFLDLDFSLPVGEAAREREVLSDVLSALPEAARVGGAVVLRREPCVLDHDADEDGRATAMQLLKMGIHVVWTDLVVDVVGAMAIRSHIVQRCCELRPDLAWEKIVDASVYRSGLRMAFSCKGPSTGPRSAYVPEARVDLSTMSPPEQQGDSKPTLDLLAACSIHVDPRRPAAAWSRLPDGFCAAAQPGAQSCRRAAAASSTESLLARSDEERIRAVLPDAYRDCAFTSVRSTRSRAFVYLDSRFCHNLGREHRSNRVYLMVDARGVWQKCFCKCDTLAGRVQGVRCSEMEHLLSDTCPLPALAAEPPPTKEKEPKDKKTKTKKQLKRKAPEPGGVLSSIAYWASKAKKAQEPAQEQQCRQQQDAKN